MHTPMQKFNPNFLGEAAHTVVYILNKTRTKVLKGKSPLEA